MNRDDVIRMAREAGNVSCDCCLPRPLRHEMENFLVSFAALVAAAELEACAQVADGHWVLGMSSAVIADAIRARGDA